MEISTDLIYDVKRDMLAKYPRFGSEIAVANIEFKDNLPYHTAATDGKNIYIDPNYFASLSQDDRVFIIAHEIMHIKFMHMYRLMDKKGKMRDLDLWNTATDAIINANLERDGFRIKEGYVNMPEALNYSAEEFYQKLLKEKEMKQNEQQSGQNQEQGDGQEQEQDKCQGDDHSLWEEVYKQQDSKENGQKQNNTQQEHQQEQQQKQQQEQQQEQTGEEQADMNFDEREEFEENRKEKIEKFKSRRKKTQKDIRSTKEDIIKLGSIGKSKEDIDWRILLRREMEKTEIVWSQKRSIAENNFAYRMEENTIEDYNEAEIMIDVSGSVKLELIKAFLREIKSITKILKKIRVGCFNEEFWGFVDIRNEKDIDNFTIPREARGDSAWTEDWDLAVRSFTKKRYIYKIIFTDGYPCPGTMPKEDLKREDVIWLVYGNKNFKPCCGKVINIPEKQLKQLHQIEKNISIEDIDR